MLDFYNRNVEMKYLMWLFVGFVVVQYLNLLFVGYIDAQWFSLVVCRLWC